MSAKRIPIPFGLMFGHNLHMNVIYPEGDDNRIRVDVLGFYPIPVVGKSVYRNLIDVPEWHQSRGYYRPIIGHEMQENFRDILYGLLLEHEGLSLGSRRNWIKSDMGNFYKEDKRGNFYKEDKRGNFYKEDIVFKAKTEVTENSNSVFELCPLIYEPRWIISPLEVIK